MNSNAQQGSAITLTIRTQVFQGRFRAFTQLGPQRFVSPRRVSEAEAIQTLFALLAGLEVADARQDAAAMALEMQLMEIATPQLAAEAGDARE